MDEVASDFVTVVEVEERKNCEDFVTVVHIGQQDVGSDSPLTEDVQIFRLPGERLGMALKFEGGACASQPIDRVFIQNINKQSPASRARGKLMAALQEGDELLRIQGKLVSGMTRINCVSCLRDERTPVGHALLSVTLTVRRVRDGKACSRAPALANGKDVQVNAAATMHANGRKGPPPPIPPRLSSTTLSTVPTRVLDDKKAASNKNTGNTTCGEAAKVNGRTGAKKSPPPLPPRRPKEPPPAAPVAHKSQQSCKESSTNAENVAEGDHSSSSPSSPSPSPSDARTAGSRLSSSNGPPVVPEVYTDTFSDKSVYLESESDDTGSSVSTIIERFSRASTSSSNISDFAGPHNNGTINIDHVLEPFEQLEREFDQKEALQKFVNETAAMLEESIQHEFAPHSASNLDDYDDIESVSMTMTGIEKNPQPKMRVSEATTNSIKEMKNLKNSHPSPLEAKASPKTAVPSEKNETSVTKLKETRTESSDKKVCALDKTCHKTPARVRSPSLIAKPRPGILKKSKEASHKANSNSCLQRKLANKSATNSLKHSLPQNSRSNTNLNQVNSMIPKIDHLKNGPLVPPPRKCRSTSNLLTAVDLDSKPSLIPRPVNKTVTFAENLVKQIQPSGSLLDTDDEDKVTDDSADSAELEPVAGEAEGAVSEADAERGGSIEEKVGEEEGAESRANDAEVDDKTVSIPLVVEDNSSPAEKSDDCLLTQDLRESIPADQLLQPQAKNESFIPCEPEELNCWQKVTQVDEEPTAADCSPSSQALSVQTHDLLAESDQSVPEPCEAPDHAHPHLPSGEDVTEEKGKADESDEMSRSRIGESFSSQGDSSPAWKGQNNPVQTRPKESFADQQRCSLLKKSSRQFHKEFKFLHEDSGVYCDAESPSPEFAKYDASLTIASGNRQAKQILQLPSPDNDSGITSDSMDEYEVASSNSSSSRDGCRKYQFKESDLDHLTQEEENQTRLLTDPLPPVRERIAHFQEQVRRSIEALSSPQSAQPPAFASCYGHNSVSKSLSDVRNAARLSCNFSSTLNITNQAAKHLRSASLTSQTPCAAVDTAASVKRGNATACTSAYAGHLQPSYKRFTSYDALVNTSPTVSPLSSLRAAGSANILTDLLESRRQSTTKLKGLMIPDPSTNSSLSIDTKMPTIVSKSSSTDQLLERAEDMNRNNTITPSRLNPASNRSAVSASLLQSFATIKNTIPKYTPAFKRRGLELSASGNSINSSPIMSPSPSMALLNPVPFSLSRSQPLACVQPDSQSPLIKSISRLAEGLGEADERREAGSRVAADESDEESAAGSAGDKGHAGGGGEEKAVRSSAESCRHFRALAQKWEQRVNEERRTSPAASSSSANKFSAPAKSLENLIRPMTLTESDSSGSQFASVVPNGKSGKDDWSKCEENVIKFEHFESWADERLSKNASPAKYTHSPSHSAEETFSKIAPTRNSGNTQSAEKASHDPLNKCPDGSRTEETDCPRAKSVPRSSRDLRGHCRFSSADSTASDSGTSTPGPQHEHSSAVGSRASSFSNLRDSQFGGSVTSLASTTSLISPQELQQLIEEANHSLKGEPSHNIQVVVLNRDYKTIGSVGIILAGGVDCETREITVHKIISGSIADRDGRIRKGDRVLSINGRIIRGLTHKEALDILRAPRPEVVLVLSRPSLTFDPTDGKTDEGLGRNPANPLSQLADDNDALNHQPAADRTYKTITAILPKDGAGLGFILEGGKDSPLGDRPLIVKKMFKGGLADKEGSLMPGDEILFVNHESVGGMTRTEAWNYLKKLPDGPVQLVVRRVDYGF